MTSGCIYTSSLFGVLLFIFTLNLIIVLQFLLVSCVPLPRPGKRLIEEQALTISGRPGAGSYIFTCYWSPDFELKWKWYGPT